MFPNPLASQSQTGTLSMQTPLKTVADTNGHRQVFRVDSIAQFWPNLSRQLPQCLGWFYYLWRNLDKYLKWNPPTQILTHAIQHGKRCFATNVSGGKGGGRQILSLA